MIKFDVVNDRNLRQVVHKLRPLIEIGGVVLIAFDNEIVAIRYTKANAEVLRHSTNEEGRIKSTLIQNPSRNAGRSCLAVCAGNDQGASAANKFFFNDFRLRAIEQLIIESC